MAMSIQDRLKELEASEAARPKGQNFLKLDEGKNEVVIDVSVAPTKNKWGRGLYSAKINGKDGTISFPPTLEIQIVRKLAKNENKFTIFRVGTGQRDTKYSVK